MHTSLYTINSMDNTNARNSYIQVSLIPYGIVSYVFLLKKRTFHFGCYKFYAQIIKYPEVSGTN